MLRTDHEKHQKTGNEVRLRTVTITAIATNRGFGTFKILTGVYLFIAIYICGK